MGLLVTDSLAAYTCWGILSAFVPVLKSGSRTWRMPEWLRAAAITLIAWGIPAMPARWAHALACTAVVLLVMITALRLGAAMTCAADPDEVTVNSLFSDFLFPGA